VFEDITSLDLHKAQFHSVKQSVRLRIPAKEDDEGEDAKEEEEVKIPQISQEEYARMKKDKKEFPSLAKPTNNKSKNNKDFPSLTKPANNKSKNNKDYPSLAKPVNNKPTNNKGGYHPGIEKNKNKK
jgi:hypothetical protein